MSTTSPHDRGRVDLDETHPDAATPTTRPDIEVIFDVEAPQFRRQIAVPSPARPPVFAGAARYRPVIVGLVLALAIATLYGVVGVGSILFEGASPDRIVVQGGVIDRTVVGSSGSSSRIGSCTSVSGSVFADSDANGIRNPWDPTLDVGEVDLVVRGTDGFVRRISTAGDGSYRLDLPATMPVTVALADPAALAWTGLWQGPRTLGHAGEAVAADLSCRADIGMWWLPETAPEPRLFDPFAVAGSSDPEAFPDEGAGALVQVHGRIWFDTDRDGRHAPDEPARAGVVLELLDDAGAVVATATTGDDGLYAFANLSAYSLYTLRVTGDDDPVVVRFLGRSVPVDRGVITFVTGPTQAAVWGLDIAYVDPDAPPAPLGGDARPEPGRPG